MSGSSIAGAGGGSLAGVRVVDLSRVLAGPFCTQMLADHGADVVKVEPPAGDETRGWGPPFEDGTSAYFSGINRNKRDIAVDIASPAGRVLILRLLETADVLIENFRTGTLERWGLGPDELLARFPRLVVCRISGFGADGPMGGLPGYDAVMQAYAGFMSINAEPGGIPLRLPVPVVDLTTGMHAFSGILLALVERAHSGKGQVVDVALLDSAASVLHPHAANWFMAGVRPEPAGPGHPNVSPYESFAAGTGRLFVAALNNRQFVGLCDELGVPELAVDPRFVDNADRVAHRHELRAALEPRLADLDAVEVGARLMARGVPAAPERQIPEFLADPQVAHRQMVVEVEGYRGTGIPVKLSRTPGSVRRKPPRFAQDTDEVLAELGYTADDRAKLAADGVVVEPAGRSRRPTEDSPTS